MIMKNYDVTCVVYLYIRISTKAYTKKSYGYLHVHIEITPSTQTNATSIK